MPSEFSVKFPLTKGISPYEDADKLDVGYMEDLENLRPTSTGLVAVRDLEHNIVDANVDLDWPYPQYLKLGMSDFLMYGDVVFTVNRATMTLTPVVVDKEVGETGLLTGSAWHGAGMGKWNIFTNVNTLMYTDLGATHKALNTVTVQSVTNWGSRIVLGGVDGIRFAGGVAEWNALFAQWRLYAPTHYQLTNEDLFDASWLICSREAGGDVDRPFFELLGLLGFPATHFDLLEETLLSGFSTGQLFLIPVQGAGVVYKVMELGNALMVYGRDGVFSVSHSESGPIVQRVLRTGIDSRDAVCGDGSEHVMIGANSTMWRITKDGPERLGYAKTLGVLSDCVGVFDEELREFRFSDGSTTFTYRGGELYKEARHVSAMWDGYGVYEFSNLVYGADLITYPGFASSVGWTLGTAWTHNASELLMGYAKTGAETTTLTQAPVVSTEKLYRHMMEYKPGITGTATIMPYVGGVADPHAPAAILNQGCYTSIIPAANTGASGVNVVGAVGTARCYRITLKEITNFYYESVFDTETLTADDTKWTCDPGWVYDEASNIFTGTVVTGSAVQAYLDQVATHRLEDEYSYLITIDVVCTAGTVQIEFNGSAPAARIINATSTYVFLHPCNIASPDFKLTGAAFTGTVTVSVKRWLRIKTPADVEGDHPTLGDVYISTMPTRLDSDELKRISFVECVYNDVANARMRLAYRYTTGGTWLYTPWTPDNGQGTFYFGVMALEYKFQFRGTPTVLAGTATTPTRVEQLTVKVMYADSRSARGPRGTGLQAEQG